MKRLRKLGNNLDEDGYAPLPSSVDGSEQQEQEHYSQETYRHRVDPTVERRPAMPIFINTRQQNSGGMFNSSSNNNSIATPPPPSLAASGRGGGARRIGSHSYSKIGSSNSSFGVGQQTNLNTSSFHTRSRVAGDGTTPPSPITFSSTSAVVNTNNLSNHSTNRGGLMAGGGGGGIGNHHKNNNNNTHFVHSRRERTPQHDGVSLEDRNEKEEAAEGREEYHYDSPAAEESTATITPPPAQSPSQQFQQPLPLYPHPSQKQAAMPLQQKYSSNQNHNNYNHHLHHHSSSHDNGDELPNPTVSHSTSVKFNLASGHREDHHNSQRSSHSHHHQDHHHHHHDDDGSGGTIGNGTGGGAGDEGDDYDLLHHHGASYGGDDGNYGFSTPLIVEIPVKPEATRWQSVLAMVKKYFLWFHMAYIAFLALLVAGILLYYDYMNASSNAFHSTGLIDGNIHHPSSSSSTPSSVHYDVFYYHHNKTTSNITTVNIGVIDAVYIGMSGATSAGMFPINAAEIPYVTQCLWHVCALFGATVFTSFFPPLLRVLMLKALQRQERDVSTIKRKRLVNKLLTTAVIMCWVIAIYWFVCHLICWMLFVPNSSSVMAALLRAIGTFSNAGFMTVPLDLSSDYGVLCAICIFVPAGSPLFPVFLRLTLYIIRAVFRIKRKLSAMCNRGDSQYKSSLYADGAIRSDLSQIDSTLDDFLGSGAALVARRNSMHNNESFIHNGGAGGGGGSGSTEDGSQFQRDRFDSSHFSVFSRATSRLSSGASSTDSISSNMTSLAFQRARQKNRRREHHLTNGEGKVSRWELGVDCILYSRNPTNYHQWLFTTKEALNLLLIWFGLMLLLFVPLVIQTHDDGLQDEKTFSSYSTKSVLLILCQCLCTRFSGIPILDLNLVSAATIMIFCFVMYIPPVPLEQHKLVRQHWKQLIHHGVLRIFGNRLSWLFISVVLLLFLEETYISNTKVAHWRDGAHGLEFRVIFEVLSAYMTCGLSLTMTDAEKQAGSLSAGFSTIGKGVIILIMFAGRHRNMDVQIDLGLQDLENDEEEQLEQSFGLGLIESETKNKKNKNKNATTKSSSASGSSSSSSLVGRRQRQKLISGSSDATAVQSRITLRDILDAHDKTSDMADLIGLLEDQKIFFPALAPGPGATARSRSPSASASTTTTATGAGATAKPPFKKISHSSKQQNRASRSSRRRGSSFASAQSAHYPLH